MIEPRFWIIELVKRLPWWLDWFGAWLVKRETDRVLKAIEPALSAITLLAKLSAPIRVVPAYELGSMVPVFDASPPPPKAPAWVGAMAYEAMRRGISAEQQAAFLNERMKHKKTMAAAYSEMFQAIGSIYGGRF